MRIEEYTRKLVGVGFAVVGSDVHDYSDHDDWRCDPIEMSQTTRDDGRGGEYPVGDSLDTLLQRAQADFSCSVAPDDEGDEFMDHFAEIFRDERLNWQLGEFNVRLGEIVLWYGNFKSQSTGNITISGARDLRLTFRTTRTRLGFDPVYHVRIQHDEHEQHKCTEVEEDLGYMRRFIKFESEGQDSDIVRVTEFVGM